MTDKVNIRIGGDIEKSLKGEYDFDLKAVLNEGWTITKHTKGVMFSGLLISFAIAYALIRYFVFSDGELNIETIQKQMDPFVEIAITVLIVPFMTSVQMMGIQHSIGGKSQFNQLFHYIPSILLLATTELATMILAGLGLYLNIVIWAYLLIALTFAIPLVAERQLTPFKAIYYSLRIVSYKWWKFILLYTLFFVLFMLCFLTMGLASYWVGPFFYNVKGILYRDIFGMTVSLNQPTNKEINEESTFNA